MSRLPVFSELTRPGHEEENRLSTFRNITSPTYVSPRLPAFSSITDPNYASPRLPIFEEMTRPGYVSRLQNMPQLGTQGGKRRRSKRMRKGKNSKRKQK